MKTYGLWRHYINLKNDALYKWIKQLMALPMLPVSSMTDGFQLLQQQLDSKAKSNKLKKFSKQLKQLSEYYSKQWLKPGMIEMVCVNGQVHRTNNYSECK